MRARSDLQLSNINYSAMYGLVCEVVGVSRDLPMSHSPISNSDMPFLDCGGTENGTTG